MDVSLRVSAASVGTLPGGSTNVINVEVGLPAQIVAVELDTITLLIEDVASRAAFSCAAVAE